MDNKKCYFCDSCDSCKCCDSCDYCEYCENCYYCKYCDYCKYCEYCYNCKNCENCDSCDSCENLVNGFMCINLKLKEKDPSKYWIFNKEVSEEEWKKRREIGKDNIKAEEMVYLKDVREAVGKLKKEIIMKFRREPWDKVELILNFIDYYLGEKLI